MALGGTVAEIKQRMTYSEALQWFAYRRKHGGIGEARTQYLLACIATMTNNAAGGKAELRDFLPGLPVPEAKVIDNADEFLNYIMGGNIYEQ